MMNVVVFNGKTRRAQRSAEFGKRVAASLAMVLIAVGSAWGQMEPPMRGPGAQRLEQFKKIRLMEALKLDEETSIRFFARYNKNQEALQELLAKRNEIIDRLQAARRSNAPEAEYDKLLREVRETDAKIYESRVKHLDECAEVLTKAQLATYVVFERNFLRDLRDLMREMQVERREMRRR